MSHSPASQSSASQSSASPSLLKLPERPSLDHLKNQAYDLQRQAAADGKSIALAEAYHQLALRYGFASWPKLKTQVELLNDPTLAAIVNAIKADDVAEVARLLALYPQLLHARGPTGYSFLHRACDKSVAMLRTILDAGLPVDTRMPTGETVLHFAATYPQTDRVIFLLERGATPTLEGGGDGGTPIVHALFHGCTANATLLAERSLTPLNLRVAAGLGRVDLLEQLWPAGGSLTSQAGAHRGWYRPHDELPEQKITNLPAEIVGEALIYAGMNDQAAAIDWLIDRGVDVDSRPHWGVTAMHWAAILGKRKAIDTLLGRGADVDLQDHIYRGFPWGWAAEGKHAEIEKLTLQYSRKLDLFQACNFGAGIDRVRSILAADPESLNRVQDDPPICGRHKRGTALHEAVDWYKRDVMLLLLDHGADIHARTQAGLTPLGIAIERKNEEAILILRERGGVE